MRTLQAEWQCNPETNELMVSATIEGETCQVRVQIEFIKREIQRVTDYLNELVNEVKHEPSDKQNHVSVVS